MGEPGAGRERDGGTNRAYVLSETSGRPVAEKTNGYEKKKDGKKNGLQLKTPLTVCIPGVLYMCVMIIMVLIG